MVSTHVSGHWKTQCSFTSYRYQIYTHQREFQQANEIIVLFHNNFPQQWAAQTPYISSWVIITNCQLYSNISQILRLYKTCGYQNKFDSTKSLEVCYRCVIIPQSGYMDHGLKHIMFYVKKHRALLTMCHNPALVCDRPLGAPTSVKLIY